MSQYIPKETAILKNPTAEDIKYAQAFDLIAEVLTRSGQREKLTLVLSTCRNAFLTTNALFVDLRLTLGHGKRPSLLSQAIFFLRERQVERCLKCLHEASLPLSEYERKRSVWTERHQWLDLLEKTINESKAIERDQIKRVLHIVRTNDPDRDQHWDKKYYELSTDEPALITEALQVLDNCYRVLAAIVIVSKGVSALFEDINLFEPKGNARLEAVFDLLTDNASPLGIICTVENEGLGKTLAWNTSTNQVRWIRNCLDAITVTAIVDAILDLLDIGLRAQYDALTKFFRPNVSIPPLPPPFCIDLTESDRGAKNSPTPVVEVKSFGLERPAKIRVALPWVGIPSGFYNTATMRLLDTKRADVEKIARGLLLAAKEEHAHVLVMPEYFLPRTIAEEVCKSAADSGIVLIAGMEGQVVGNNSHVRNEVVIQMPGHNHLTQSKINPSVYERPLESSGKVLVFKGTSLGTFGVIVCSDLLDWHIVHGLATSGTTLDVLFVCSCNPPESTKLFGSLATADAFRHYRHVVIVNNAMQSDEKSATGEGTLVASPDNPPVILFEGLKNAKDISVPEVGDCQPKLACHELSIQGLATDRIKPTDGLSAFPPWRNITF